MNSLPDLQPSLDVVANARTAQARWAATPIQRRLRVVSEFRHLLAEHATDLAASAASVSDRPIAEKLVSEVLPLGDACRWLTNRASRVLAPRRYGKRGRPLWMQGLTFEVQRQPYGVVLVVGPGNYPLFLPAVHSLQALVAGNAVLLKPAPHTREVALFFDQLMQESGLDPALLTILPESVEAVDDAISSGVDKVIFTGSSENGRDLLGKLAPMNIPSIMELNGDDAVVILPDADLSLVERALRFGITLNNSQTCIAPRRLIVVESIADALLARLGEAGLPCPQLVFVRDEAATVDCVNSSDFGLGASIFSSDVEKARQLAARMMTGFVLINDLIVPTADPRMPFGGVKASGFGTTRGKEGLLEMTFPHVVAVTKGSHRPHFDAPGPGNVDLRLFTAYLRLAHGRNRWAALRDLIPALINKIKTRSL